MSNPTPLRCGDYVNNEQGRRSDLQGDYTIGWGILLLTSETGGPLQLSAAGGNVDAAPHAQRMGDVRFVENGAEGGDALARGGRAVVTVGGVERNQVDVAQHAAD